MIELLYELFYFGVLALVMGCFVYLFVTRDQSRAGRELCSPSLEPGDTDLFRRAAQEAGLQVRMGSTEGQYCVDVKGSWPTIASTIRSICISIYGVDENEEVQARIL